MTHLRLVTNSYVDELHRRHTTDEELPAVLLLMKDAPCMLDALVEVWHLIDNIGDGAPDSSRSAREALYLCGIVRPILERHGRLP